MATGSFGGQLQSAISSRLTADPYEKRRQAAMGSYQDQAEKSRKDLSERLNRLGVLRGGGATASQFGEFESGVLRGQQALDAQFEAQREAGVGQAIQQGLGLYGTDQQFGLAGRQQTEAERMGQFSRDLGTREFLSQDALRRDQQRESERAALAQEGMQRGALTGIYDGQRTLDQQRQDLAYRTGLAQTFGTDLGGDDTTRQTEARSQRLQQEAFQRAGLIGQLGDDRTLAAQQLYGSPEATTTLQGQELALRRGELLGEIDQERTLAAQQALGSIGGEDTLARDALQQEATQASAERGLRRTEGLAERNLTRGQAGLDRQAAADLQAARITGTSELQQDQFAEAALERTARAQEAGLDRDLARAELRGFEEIDGRRVQTLAAREAGAQRRLTASESALERQARADLQQAQFGQETSQADLQRALAREEMYGRAMTEAEAQAGRYGGGTLARTGQEADIAAENRRLAEMETAGISQRGLAERELTQRAALASEQRALDREQLYGRAMTREEQMSGLGYTGGTLGAQELAQTAEQADLQRSLAREELYGYREDASGRREQTLGARESQAQRGIQERELAQRGELAGAELLSREGLARDQRSLDREALYGTGDVRRQGGATLAATQAAQDMSLRRELGRGQLAQDTRRTDLARDELRGYSELPSGYREETVGAEEARLRRGLEGRRMDEVERAGAAAEEAERNRLALASEELYGGAGMRNMAGGTLAAREAAAERTSRESMAASDIASREGIASKGRALSREELYGTGDSRQYGGATLASREAEAGREFERGERALDRREASNQASQARLLAREELYGTSDPYSQTGETLQGRLARQEQDRYDAATTLEAERYDIQRGDYAADIRRRDEQDRLQRQYEGLAASRAIDALKQSDSTYAAREEEEALINYLLRGGQGQVRDYLVDPVDTVPDPVDEFPQPVYTDTQGIERTSLRTQHPRSQRTKTSNI
jgi:hypothetical protein